MAGLVVACTHVPQATPPVVPRGVEDVTTLRVPGVPGDFEVSVEAAEVDPEGARTVEVQVHEAGRLLVLDRRASRPQPMSRCQAGEEVWLRVLDPQTREERYAKRVESCLRDIVAGEPLLSWSEDGREVTVQLVSEPSVVLRWDPSGALSASVLTAPSGDPGGDLSLPEEVRSFVARREGCDHLRGEVPYDDERAALLVQEMSRLCTGTDAELARLKRLYAQDAAVLTRLSQYEERVE